VFLLVILVSAGVAIANGVHLTLRDTSFVLATFVGFPLAVVAIYLSLRFSARKDGPFMLRTFKQILNASEASGEPSPVEVPTVH
jgi:membrane protein implicated in regulation of membrane protease activity